MPGSRPIGGLDAGLALAGRIEMRPPNPLEPGRRQADPAARTKGPRSLDEESDGVAGREVLEKMLSVDVLEVPPRPWLGHIDDFVHVGERPDIDIPPVRQSVVGTHPNLDAVDSLIVARPAAARRTRQGR